MSLTDHKLTLAALAVLAGATPAAAQSTDAPATGDRWTFAVAPYLWAISLDGDAAVGGVEADVDVPFSDAVKDLSFGAMLLVDARRGRFGIGVNSVFTRVSPDDEIGPIEIDVTTDLAQLGVGPYWRAIEWRYGESASGQPLRLILEPTVGVRVSHLRLEFEVRGGRQFDDSETWVDPVVGSRFAIDLAERWTLSGEADVGGVVTGSDLSWNVQGYLGYRTTRVRAADDLRARLPRPVGRLRPQQFPMGRYPARPDPGRGAAVLVAQG